MAPIRMRLRLTLLAAAVPLIMNAHHPPVSARSSQSSNVARSQRLPAGLDHYINTVARLKPGEVESLLDGSPVAKLLDTETSHEVAVFGAVWIKAAPERYIEAVKDIETFESPRSRHASAISTLPNAVASSPPRPESIGRFGSRPQDRCA